MSQKDTYLSWLNDAYAMEKNIEEVLSHHAGQAEDHPNIRQKIQEHLRLTQSQAERVRECIERNGGNVSSLKSGMSSVMGMFTGMSSGMASDALVKNCLAEYATEHFEIASYTSLMQAAEQMNDPQTAHVCREIIQEEQAMAHWLENNIPQVSSTVMRALA